MKKITGWLILLLLGLLQNHCFAQEKKEISFYTWKEFIDTTILEDFEKEYGIKVNLKEYETRDMMFSEIESAPEEFDVILATDVTLPMLIQSRLLGELDLTKIPNRKFIKKEFMALPFDPGGKYSVVAGLWGAAGLVINTNFVPADIDSWSAFWDPKYKGKIALMDEGREAMSAVLKYSHFSVNTTDPQELQIAEKNALLLKANDVQFGDTLSNLEKVMNGELWVVQTYNGDVLHQAADKKEIKFIYPEEGTDLTLDNLVISVDSKHKEEAHQLINFMLKPENVARNANMFFYPVTVEAEAFLHQEILINPVISPSQDVLQKSEYLMDIGEAEGEYLRIYNLLKSTDR